MQFVARFGNRWNNINIFHSFCPISFFLHQLHSSPPIQRLPMRVCQMNFMNENWKQIQSKKNMRKRFSHQQCLSDEMQFPLAHEQNTTTPKKIHEIHKSCALPMCQRYSKQYLTKFSHSIRNAWCWFWLRIWYEMRFFGIFVQFAILAGIMNHTYTLCKNGALDLPFIFYSGRDA